MSDTIKYCVRLRGNGHVSYLSVKGRTEWKTRRAAARHAKDVQTLINKGRFADGVKFAEVVEV